MKLWSYKTVFENRGDNSIDFRYVREDIYNYSLKNDNVIVDIEGESFIILDLYSWTRMIEDMYAIFTKGEFKNISRPFLFSLGNLYKSFFFFFF